MFTTVEYVNRVTGYEVTLDTIYKAQAVIEVYCGRTEGDITNRRDKSLLSRATAYQAAYMRDNAEQIFEQIMVSQQAQNDSLVSYKSGDTTAPWIAPLAVMACKKLSWFKSRSVRTGPREKAYAGYFNRASSQNWWND